MAQATKRLIDEIDRYTPSGRTYRSDPDDLIISTNVELRLDGLPYSNRRPPKDPGVCAYFTLDGIHIALPCDTFDRVEDNVAAIAGHINADRRQERYGVGKTKDRFAGFPGLPAAGEGTGSAWWEILGVEMTATRDEIKKAFRIKAKDVHPDKNNNNRAQWDVLEIALRQGLAAREGKNG